MPASEKRKSFRFKPDRERIKEAVTQLPYNEVLRFKGPIYEVLISELFVEGCLTTAKYFQCLVEEEQKLLQNGSISITVKENTNLLYALYEHFKLAEISARLVKHKCSGSTMNLFYQALLIAESAGSTYEWLSEKLYSIVVKVISEFEMDEFQNNQTKMRIYYRYGSFLAKKDLRLASAIKYLEKALDIAIGQNWIPDSDLEKSHFETMHEATACKLAHVLNQYGKTLFKVNEQKAFDQASKAIFILNTIDFERNKLQIFKTHLTKIKFALDMKNTKCALKEINRIQGQIQVQLHNDLQYVKCKLYLYKGRAYYDLEMNDKAMLFLQKAFSISNHFYIRPLEAEIQLYMGKVHAKNLKEQDYAQAAYESAKLIFIELNDLNNIRKVNYLQAKCKAAQIFPKLKKLLGSGDYCDRFELLRWKTRCVPFWCSEKLDHLEREWSAAIKSELSEENKQTQEIVKKTQSVISSVINRNKEEATSSSEEEMDKLRAIEKYEEHKLASTSTKSAMMIAIEENEINKERGEINKNAKEAKTKHEDLSEDRFVPVYLKQKVPTRIPSYREKIDKKRRMPGYQKWLKLSFTESMEQLPPLHCLTREFLDSSLKMPPKHGKRES